MTTRDSSSAVDSAMEDTSQTLTKPLSSKMKKKRNDRRLIGDDDDEREAKDESCDAKAWETLSRSFRQVQSVLDQNRDLIQQVKENQQSKIHDNLVRNVALIQEINGNISKVLNLYSDLSVNFSSIVHQRRAIMDSNNRGDEKEG